MTSQLVSLKSTVAQWSCSDAHWIKLNFELIFICSNWWVDPKILLFVSPIPQSYALRLMTELSIRTTSLIYKWIQKLTQKNPCKAHSLCSCFASCQPIDRCKLLVNKVIISGFIDIRRESHHILESCYISMLWFMIVIDCVPRSPVGVFVIALPMGLYQFSF